MNGVTANALRDEFDKIAFDDDAKLRTMAFLRTTGAAALGTALGYGTADLIRHGIAHRLGQEATRTIGARAVTYGVPALLGVGVMAGEAALRHHINKERERYIAERQATDEATRMKADAEFGIVPTPPEDKGNF